MFSSRGGDSDRIGSSGGKENGAYGAETDRAAGTALQVDSLKADRL
ncbi:MAG: hypothetical protein WA081_04005 [Desulfosalsimonadaceae bacterium]